MDKIALIPGTAPLFSFNDFVKFKSERSKEPSIASSIMSVETESVSRATRPTFKMNAGSHTFFNPGSASATATYKTGPSFSSGSFQQLALPMATLELCREQFVRTARVEQVEYGYRSGAERLLESFFAKFGVGVGAIVQHIYLREAADSRVIVPLLKAIGALRYYDAYPFAQTVAIAALTNSDCEVLEAGIRAFENWGSPDGILPLQNVETHRPWLESYRLATIQYLESIQ